MGEKLIIDLKKTAPAGVPTMPRPQTQSTPKEKVSGLSGSLLVIEDDSFMRGLLADRAKKAGLTVADTMDAERGLQLLSSSKPDVILLDLMLPGMDGYEFLLELKKRHIEDVDVIVLSNLGRREDIDRAIELGACDYLVKANFTLEGILEKVREHL
jgi:DNA-binding response OmpR family regulator